MTTLGIPLTRHAAVLTLAAACWACTGRADPRAEATAATAATAPVERKMTAPTTPHWDYGADEGPARWASLSSDFAACGNGKQQSPVDLGTAATATLPAMQAAHRPIALHVMHNEHVADGINNGHSIQVNYAGADTLVLGDERYALMQYHFHAPSEHTVKGTHFPMEMHLVHKAADGRLAVIGVPIASGGANAAIAPVWANLPKAKGNEVVTMGVQVDVDEMMPSTLTTWRYDGSLTTPPCSEGVKWLVMTTPIEFSPEQIAAFTGIVNNNNRPVQALNGRTIATDRVAETQ